MKKNLLPILLITIYNALSAQSQNPSSLQYTSITTPHFSVIVPDDILSRGIETANLMEAAYYRDAQSFSAYPKKYRVMLFNQTVISNGYTTLAPRHIGFYTTPPQEAGMAGGTDWLQTLTIHEFRHAVQFRKLDTNFISFAGRVFGDYGKVVSMYIAVPFWVFEGDAVCNETIYTREGRGRLPYFTRDIRALESEGIRYSYYKAYLGSYRNYFPDHYHLGYLMYSHLRKNYGIGALNRVMDISAQYPFYPLIFSEGLKRVTKYSIKKSYNNTLNEFDTLIVDELNSVIPSNYTPVNTPDRRAYTNYSYPSIIDADKILALKSGFNDDPTIVIIEKGKENKLEEINPADRISTNGKIVTWASSSADIRWGMRSYSDIMVFDIDQHKLRVITRQGKYFAPAVSPDGTMIAAVKYGDNMRCILVLIKTDSGKEMVNVPFGEEEFARMPSWSDDGEKILFTVSCGQMRNISVYDLKTNAINKVLPDSYESISNPVFYKEYILFNSTVTGIDAIHAMDTLTGERYVIATGKYGAYNPSISADGSTFVFENYTTGGMQIAMQEIDRRQWLKLSETIQYHNNYYDPLIAQEGAVSIFDSVDLANREGFQINRYRPLLHAVNIHSWAPYPVTNGVAFAVFSDDILNTTTINGGVAYFSKDNAVQEFINLSYAKYFPVFDLGFSNGRRYDYFSDSVGDNYRNKFDEQVLSAGIRIPLDFSRHIYTTTLTFGAGYKYLSYKFIEPDSIRYHVSALEYSLSFSRSKQMTRRDINPRFGQEINILYQHSILKSNIHGDRLLADACLYLPGLMNHHSLVVSGGFQQSSPDFKYNVYQLTNDLEHVRGYDPEYTDRYIKGTLDYTLPLVYPDLALGPVFYLKRISANLFYDHGWLKTDGESKINNSVGIDLNFDFHLFSFMPLPITMGIRYSYRLTDNKNAFEILLFRTPVY